MPSMPGNSGAGHPSGTGEIGARPHLLVVGHVATALPTGTTKPGRPVGLLDY